MSQYVLTQILQTIQNMLIRAGVANQDSALYQTFINAVSAPNSDLQRKLLEHLNAQTNGMWVNGVPENQMLLILKPWVDGWLNYTNSNMRTQQPNYQQSGGYTPNGYIPPHAVSPTSGMYGGDSQQPAPAVVQQQQPVVIQPLEKDVPMKSFESNTPINLDLQSADTLQHHPKEGNVVSVDNYREGAFEKIRISTIDIKLNVAENNPRDAATKVITYSPNEVLRGIFCNVVTYKELFHIPMKSSEFKRIATMIGSAFYGLEKRRIPEWRDAVSAMGSLNRFEHKVFETALLEFLNPSLFKSLRTADLQCIAGIQELDDLKELDDARSRLKITKHAQYTNVFNGVVSRAFDMLLNPSHQIDSEDVNFGDFVHCDKIEFWYDGRSKYDYGTYENKADRLKFIDTMTASHTVLRVSKNLIITNAIDPQIASNIKRFRAQDSLQINGPNNIGCKLLLELDQPKRTEIETVVCLGENATDAKDAQLINLGRTLDGQLVLTK